MSAVAASFEEFCRVWPMRSDEERAEAEQAFRHLAPAQQRDAIAATPGIRTRIGEFEAEGLDHGITPRRFLASPYLRYLGLKLAGPA